LKAFCLDALGLAGLHQAGSGAPVLALHGWLDNANSFLDLAPHLDGLELVALDLPGHGLSRPRPEGVRYHFDDYVFDILAAVEALGWDRFHLLGHSLGGAVSSILAAACPKAVVSLTLIEGLGPLSAPPDRTTSGWRKALANSRQRPRRIHADIDAAVRARANNSDLDLSAARQLAGRGLEPVDGGFRWRHDQRLTWPSTQRYTEPQVLDLLRAIEAPVFNIYSDPPSGILPAPMLERRLAALKQQQLFCAPGGHHLHMHQPALLGPVIKEFFHGHHTAN
jgi:pimeloyl-ACP methyl ester carboxylesterase